MPYTNDDLGVAVRQYVADQLGVDYFNPAAGEGHTAIRRSSGSPVLLEDWTHGFPEPTLPQLEAAWAKVEILRQRGPNAIAGMQSIQNAVKQINSPATAASYLTANYDLTGVPAGAQQALRDIYYAYSMLVRRMYSNENDWFNTGE